jgi:hypothetical protein
VSEIAQEIRVLLEHDDLDSSASEQETQDHSGGSSACDAATRSDGLNFGFLLRHAELLMSCLRKRTETNPPYLRKVREGWATRCRAWAYSWLPTIIIAIEMHKCISGKSLRRYRSAMAFELKAVDRGEQAV